MEEDKFTILVDDRERESGLIDLLSKAEIFELEIKRLVSGDVVVRDLCIERKTGLDFIDSLKDGRLFRQLNGMRYNFRRVMLIIEGVIPHFLRETTLRSVRGALLKISAGMQIPVCKTENVSDTAEHLIHLATQEYVTSPTVVPIRNRKPQSIAYRQLYLVSGLPLVGPVRGKALLDTFGTVEAIFSADKTALQKTTGIGPKQAEVIYRVGHEKYVDN